MLKFIAVVLLCCSVAFGLRGQSTNASITGYVTDPSKSVIPDAKVVAINVSTNARVEATTNGIGSYTIVNLSPGSYRVEVEKPGFKTVVKSDIVLHVQDAVAINFEMAIGSTSEVITVTGGTPLVNTETAAVGTVITREQVENMPLNGRSFQSLIALTPGVVLANVSTSFGTNPGQFSVNGQRSYSNYFTVDGVSSNAGITANTSNTSGFAGAQPAFTAQGTTQGLVSVDALQEFRIQTSSYSPEFGRSPGGQIDLVTRSGTNQFHGTASDYLRNDVLDANDWFANQSGQRKPRERQNDFGGTFSGPVLIPGLYNGRDATFFFFSYEGLRLRQPVFLLTQVPSATLRQTAAPTVQPILNAFPQPNGPNVLNAAGQPTGMAQFADSHSNPSRLDAASLKIDHKFNSRFSIFGSYSDAPSSVATRNLSIVTTTEMNTQRLTIGSGIVLNNSIFNDLRANYTWANAQGSLSPDSFGGAVPLAPSVFAPITADQPGNQFTQFIFTLPGASLAALTGGLLANNLQHQANIVDSLSIAKGAHAMKFGIDYRRLSPVIAASQDSLVFSFSSIAGVASAITAGTSLSHRITGAHPVLTNWSLYGQDTWRLNRRLTITYGLRWEVNLTPHNSNGPDPAVLTGLDSPATFALAPVGTPIFPTRYHDFAPRAGIAYRLRQRSGWETVVRGGGGIFYDLGNTDATVGFDSGFPFQAISTFVNAPYPPTAALLTPPTVSLNPPYVNAKFGVYDLPDFDLPYTAQWNVALEQGLGALQTLTASYVGHLGRRLLHRQTYSAANPSFPGVVSIFRSDSTSDYEALQMQFQRRLSQTLQALVSYSYQHAIDDISDDTFFGGLTGGASANRGNSSFDVRHSFSASASYNLPHFAGTAGRILLNGWAMDLIVRAQTATPVDLLTTARVINGVQAATRPNLVGGLPLYLSDSNVPGGRRFNTAAFVTPPVGIPQGTLGRNVLHGLGASEADLAIRRQFRLTERVNLQARLEAFNVLNHPNFGNLNLTVGSANLGIPQSMLNTSLGSSGALSSLYQFGGPRSMQVMLKLAF